MKVFWRNRAKILVLVFVFALIAAACGDSTTDTTAGDVQQTTGTTQAPVQETTATTQPPATAAPATTD